MQFKLKKQSKTIGNLDINDKSEFTLLRRTALIGDMDDFLHIQKLWNIEETNDELDSDGNIIKPGIKKRATFIVTEGFIKNDKFLISSQRTYNGSTFNGMHNSFCATLKGYIEDGYQKDMNSYDSNDVPITPKYYINETQEFGGPFVRNLKPLMKMTLNNSQNQNP